MAIVWLMERRRQNRGRDAGVLGGAVTWRELEVT